jgi:hypothetical protein
VARSLSEDERYEATKRLYARMFAVMEGYRWTLKGFSELMDPGDVDRIEADVRERIRKQREKARANGDLWFLEEKKKAKS